MVQLLQTLKCFLDQILMKMNHFVEVVTHTNVSTVSQLLFFPELCESVCVCVCVCAYEPLLDWKGFEHFVKLAS